MMLLRLAFALAVVADAPAVAPQAPAPGLRASAAEVPGGTQADGHSQNAAAGSSVRAANECPQSAPDSRQIVICAERPQGYRLNPDVMEAKREVHSGGRPVRPGGTVRPDCATVGPAPCVNAGINLLAAAATAAEMAQRLSKGQEIGSMFMTDPHPDEYHLYLMAKARREAEEKEKSAAAAAKAAQSKARPAPVQSNGGG